MVSNSLLLLLKLVAADFTRMLLVGFGSMGIVAHPACCKGFCLQTWLPCLLRPFLPTQ